MEDKQLANPAFTQGAAEAGPCLADSLPMAEKPLMATLNGFTPKPGQAPFDDSIPPVRDR